MASFSKVSRYLSGLGRTYHRAIPLADIFATLRASGLEPIMEDGTPWSGLLLGREGHALIELRRTAGRSRYLSLSWHKMDVTGSFEVTAYVS